MKTTFTIRRKLQDKNGAHKKLNTQCNFCCFDCFVKKRGTLKPLNKKEKKKKIIAQQNRSSNQNKK